MTISRSVNNNSDEANLRARLIHFIRCGNSKATVAELLPLSTDELIAMADTLIADSKAKKRK